MTALCAQANPGDVIIDGGNSFYKDDIRRAAVLNEKGLHYVDVGTSGGVWGLERGYCMMIGGPDEAVRRLEAAGVPGAQVVDVHAVRHPPRRGAAGGDQRLAGDMPADDVVDPVVQLGGHEVLVVDAVDVEGGDDVGQRRLAVRNVVAHPCAPISIRYTPAPISTTPPAITGVNGSSNKNRASTAVNATPTPDQTP